MDDPISRQAAIDAINHICPVDIEYDCTLLDRVDVRCVLSELPTAEKRGRWIVVDGQVVCSECYNANIETNYCPNCGAKMGE